MPVDFSMNIIHNNGIISMHKTMNYVLDRFIRFQSFLNSKKY
jgi:hypothetical protein